MEYSIRVSVDHSTLKMSQRQMLPTPATSHVDFDKIYEPSEDSFLLLDTLSSPSEAKFLAERFGSFHNAESVTPLILEVGIGSGVVLAFVTANAQRIFGRSDVLAMGTDVNIFACKAARRTVLAACEQINSEQGLFFTDTITADLASPIRRGSVDVLIFNPPYVPTPGVLPLATDDIHTVFEDSTSGLDLFARDSHLLSMSYAGGVDGMEVTDRLLKLLPDVLNQMRGVGYILLCQQNKPEEVLHNVRQWGAEWSVAIVGQSGKQGGWEKLCIIRIARVMMART